MPYTQVPVAFKFDQVLGQIVWKGIVIAPSGSAGGGPTLLSAVGAWAVPPGAAVGDLLKVTAPFVGSFADSSIGALMPAAGMIYAIVAPGIATVAYAGEVPGLFGLTPGAIYYAKPSGGISVLPPGPGEYVQKIGTAASAGTFLFNPDAATILL